MALPNSRSDREYKKFQETADGDVAVRVTTDAPGSGASSSSEGLAVNELNPLDTKNVALLQDAITNQATYPDNRYIDVKNYNSVTVGYKKNGGTDTIALTLGGATQDDGTTSSSVSYHDISQYGIEPKDQASGAASYASNLFAAIDTSAMSYLELTVDRSAGTADDADYELYVRASAL